MQAGWVPPFSKESWNNIQPPLKNAIQVLMHHWVSILLLFKDSCYWDKLCNDVIIYQKPLLLTCFFSAFSSLPSLLIARALCINRNFLLFNIHSAVSLHRNPSSGKALPRQLIMASSIVFRAWCFQDPRTGQSLALRFQKKCHLHQAFFFFSHDCRNRD